MSKQNYTDQSVLDQIAVGLGTSMEWDGAEALEWIASLISEVRPNVGVEDSKYEERFEAATGRKVDLNWVVDSLEDRRYAYDDYLPDSLDDLEVGEYLKPLEVLGQLEARGLWVCSYCEHLAGGGEEGESGTSEADMFFQKCAAPDYSIALLGELRAGQDPGVAGMCDVCSSLDMLGQIKLARIWG